MRVTPKDSGTPRQPEASAAELKRTGRDRQAGGAGPSPGRRDFASVLKELTSADGETEGREACGEAEEASPAPHASADKTRRRVVDGAEEGHEFAADARGKAVEVAPRFEVHEARPVLHGTDLERIVVAVNTQLDGGGQRELTLELSRSVLAGLRVRLSADAGGRISAEFIAADDEVRSLLERRSHELADALRSRGIDLSSLKTSSDAGTPGHGREGRGDSLPARGSEAAGESGTTPAADSAETPTGDAGWAERAEQTTKYRA